MADQVHVARHDSLSFDRLKEVWASLAGGAVASPFQLPVFLDAFQRHMSSATCGQLSLVCASLSSGRPPEALLPLVTVRRGPVNVVTLPDLGLSDQNAPVLSRPLSEKPGLAAEICTALLRAVRGGDVIDIPKISPLIGTVVNPLYARPETIEMGRTCFFDADGLEAIATQPVKSVFKEARTKFRKLQRQGVELVDVTTPKARSALLAQLLAHRQARFEALDRNNSIEIDNRADFYRALSEKDDSGNPFKMLALMKGEEVVAAVALMVHGESANGILVSIGDPSWHRLSPGIVLVVQSLCWARDNGIRHFSLGTGLQDYKKRFGAAEQPVRRLLRPLSVKGRAFLTAFHAKQHAKSFLEQFDQGPGS